MGDGYAAIQRGGGLPVLWGWGQSDDSYISAVTTQRKAFKYVMASGPYRYT
jgi:hypothetical protein